MTQLRLMRFLPGIEQTDFTLVNFKTGLPNRLEKKHTLVKGERVRTEYYSSAMLDPISGDTIYDPSDLIVQEDYSFQRDADGYPLTRVGTIYWLNEDGSFHENVKQTLKTYSPLERSREVLRRRRNVIDFLKYFVLYAIGATENVSQTEAITLGREFFTLYTSEVDLYLETDDPVMIAAVNGDSTIAWLDNDLTPLGIPMTLRAYIVEELEPPV